MIELIEANWLILVIALLIGVLVAWWLFAAKRHTKVEIEPPEEPAGERGPRRNQALIDAPPAAAGRHPPADMAMRESAADARVVSSVAPPGLAGAGVAVAAAAAPAPAPSRAPSPEPANDAPPPPCDTLTSPASPPIKESAPDDLTRIKGLGPKLAAQLNALGVTSLSQIAFWDDAEIDRIDAQLGRFEGRIRRDHWPEQARLLAAGDEESYEERFGRL